MDGFIADVSTKSSFYRANSNLIDKQLDANKDQQVSKTQLSLINYD